MSNELKDLSKKLKEYQWLILLILLVITISKDLITDIIGKNIYNLIIIFIMILFGIYLECYLIRYIKNPENAELKRLKVGFIISSILIFSTVIYFIFLLIS